MNAPVRLLFSSVLALIVALPAPSAFAFSAAIHEDLTKSTFTDAGFSAPAIKEIVGGNLITDKDEWTIPYAHFDNEQFSKGARRLRDRFALATSAARSGNFRESRAQIGRCLHAIQDFYAHSNFVENHSAESSIDLFQLEDPAAELGCDGRYPVGGLSSGYFPMESRPNPWKCTHKDLNKDRPKARFHAEARNHALRATARFYEHFVSQLRAEAGDAEAEKIVHQLKTAP